MSFNKIRPKFPRSKVRKFTLSLFVKARQRVQNVHNTRLHVTCNKAKVKMYAKVLQGLRNSFASGKTRSVDWRIQQLEGLKRFYEENEDVFSEVILVLTANSMHELTTNAPC